MSLRKTMSAGFAALVASAGLVSIAPAAEAEVDCTLGYACLWEDKGWSGASYGKKFDGPVKSTMDNEASSAWANGNQCPTTRFYDYGQQATGSYFVLTSEKIGTNYKDPDLSNGAGTGESAKENWNDRVSRIWFGGC